MANLLKNYYFHGDHGSLPTETYVMNVFLDGPMGTLYVNLLFVDFKLGKSNFILGKIHFKTWNNRL